MNRGCSLVELATEVARQQSAKRDLIVPTVNMRMDQKQLVIGNETLPLRDHAHSQLADYLKIPRKYYDRLLDESNHPALLSDHVNHWLAKDHADDKKMVRLMDGSVRAVLSSRYRRLDHVDLLETILPVLSGPNFQIESCNVTDKKLYLKAIFPGVQGEVKVGDIVQSGIVISNSEIGSGSVLIQPFLHRLVCANGMIMNDSSLNKHHIGRDLFNGEGIQHLLTEKTVEQTDLAFWMSVRDIVASSLNQVQFNKYLDKLKVASGEKITKRVEEVVELTQKRFQLSDTDRESVLKNLITGGDLSRWGLANAVTAVANDTKDYDRATELESIGGEIIELGRRDWSVLAEAA